MAALPWTAAVEHVAPPRDRPEGPRRGRVASATLAGYFAGNGLFDSTEPADVT